MRKIGAKLYNISPQGRNLTGINCIPRLHFLSTSSRQAVSLGKTMFSERYPKQSQKLSSRTKSRDVPLNQTCVNYRIPQTSS